MSQTTIDRARRNSTAFDRLFLDHPRDVEETYLQHMAASAAFGFSLLRLAGAAFIHALVPGLHKTTVSTAVRAMEWYPSLAFASAIGITLGSYCPSPCRSTIYSAPSSIAFRIEYFTLPP